MFLNRPGCSILMEMALGYFGEYNVKWIYLSLKVIFKEVDAQFQKLSSEEKVSKVDLQQAIKQV